MSPRWLTSLVCLILVVMVPVPVTPQVVTRIIRTALCTVSSGAFITLNCVEDETTPCRVLAFKMSLLCRTFPCTNYGTVAPRSCEAPLGCPPWNIRAFGLCGPLEVCCGQGLISRWRSAPRQPRLLGSNRRVLPRLLPRKRRFAPHKRGFAPRKRRFAPRKRGFGPETRRLRAQSAHSQNKVMAYHNNVTIPSTPEEYMKDWPQYRGAFQEEEILKQQYEKFANELTAINTQEMEEGREESPVQIPSFQGFRSVALGNTPAVLD